ncbi:MAG: Sec-independent protein translocase subunit TatA [Actinomycetes bacterium]
MGKLFDNPTILVILIVAVIVIFGSKRLPDAARGVGRSLRILKAETKGLMTDDEGNTTQPAQPAQPAQPVQPAQTVQQVPVAPAPQTIPAPAPVAQPVQQPVAPPQTEQPVPPPPAPAPEQPQG